MQLCKRHVPDSGPCIFCNRGEAIEHALLTCQFFRLNRKHFCTHKQWLFDFLATADDLQASTSAVGFWYIWEARNKA
jgi:hypothetical protein